ncbi:TPA: hypothetical protein ACY2YW_002954, partial [Listeria monocytogenes]
KQKRRWQKCCRLFDWRKKMKHLSLDLETYSSVDLSKCGVYKYSESPDFEILLFAYSVDGGPVEVVDLKMDETIPAEILTSLSDETVIKHAFNASFERVCLSRFLGLDGFLNPRGWQCTMVWGATLGLPLSLVGVGAVLGLDKLSQDMWDYKNELEAIK